MKSFFQFLESTATQQAARLGLKGDGHGGWYDNTGEFVAKTEKGQLKFYNKRQRVGQQDPRQTDLERNISDPNFTDPALQQQQAPAPQEVPMDQQSMEQQPVADPMAQEPEKPVRHLPVEKTKGTLTIGFGRFNPPHAGHAQLMDMAASSATEEGDDYVIVPSRTNDPEKNPLDPDTKISLMRKMFPQHSEKIINDPANVTIFDVLKKAHNDGYANVRIMGGSDRTNAFNKLSNQYNGDLYNFDNIEIVSSGERDDDAEGIEGYSASRMRLAAKEDDFKSFFANLQREEEVIDPETGEPMVDPETGEPMTQLVPVVDRKIAKELFNATKESMGIGVTEDWRIAPKFNYQILRENYIKDKIFKLGKLVEDLNTGLIGRIIRRGTNYLICVTEDKIMFKSWIKDVNETVVNGTVKSGVGPDDRLIGTDRYRKYVESLVPGSSYGIQFINKYRKK